MARTDAVHDTAVVKRATVVAVALFLVVAACQAGRQKSPATGTAETPGDATTRQAGAVTPAGEPAVPERPRPVLFPAGGTIAEDDLGLYLLDPTTGAAEGWGSSPDGRCRVDRAFDDGRKLLFACQPPQQPGTPVGTQIPTDATMYALDRTTGAWSPIAGEHPYGLMAPNGHGLTPEARAAVASLFPGAPESDTYEAAWSPDSSALVIGGYIVRMDSTVAVRLPDVPFQDPQQSVTEWWAPDGSKVALVSCCRDSRYGTVTVVDAHGRSLWSREVMTFFGNPRWSPDSTWLGIQVLRPYPAAEAGVVYDLWVFDGANGEPAFRLINAAACAGPYWIADGRLIVDGWRDQEVVNPRSGTLQDLKGYVTPSPVDANLGISFDGNDFYAVSLADGSSRLIAHTTVAPAWDFLHEPLFAGSLIMFRPKHLGHGGCGEAIWVPESSRPQLQFPPFPD